MKPRYTSRPLPWNLVYGWPDVLRSMVSSGSLMLVLLCGSVPNVPAALNYGRTTGPAEVQIAVEKPRAC
jgi:hypothetical protein